MKCSKHPRYKGMLKPRVLCEVCWRIYIDLRPTKLWCGCNSVDGCKGHGPTRYDS